MKYLTFALAFLLVACNSKPNYKYKVTRNNYYKNRPAIFYTDTLEYSGDSLGYHNSDGSYILMSDTCGYDCSIQAIK